MTVKTASEIWRDYETDSVPSSGAHKPVKADIREWGGAIGLRGYIDGLITSNNSGTPNSKIDVAAGACRSEANVVDIVFAATKTIDCSTTGANALDAGSLANATWYHVFAISKADNTSAALASTSISSPSLPSGYVNKRRIGSFLTDGSAHIIAFSQNGEEFLWNTIVTDVNTAAQSTTAITRTLTVPTGVKVWALIGAQGDRVAASGNWTALVSPLDVSDQAAAAPGAAGAYTFMQFVAGATEVDCGAGPFAIRTNTSAQVRSRASAALAIFMIQTFGWIDQRGRNA